MRETQFSRLPLIWKRLDKQGLLERFLGVEDTELNLTRQKIQDLLDSRDLNSIPDKYLRLAGYTVGHRWKNNQSYLWNRQRISELIRRYSYKGTSLSVEDLALEYGSGFCNIVDMASKVAVWSYQGTPEEDNCYFFDADFFHPGVFLLYTSEDMDLDGFLEDFQYIRPAGTKWYFYTQSNIVKNEIGVSSTTDLWVTMDLTPSNRVAIFNESLFGVTGQRSFLLETPVDFSNEFVMWDDDSILFDGTSSVFS